MQIESTTTNKRKYIFLLAVILVLELLLAVFPVRASAEGEVTTYSNVLDDLKKDPQFNTADYPAVANDNSLQIIQVAESENNELFVYVYHPFGFSDDVKAMFLNMSLASNEVKYPKYSLYSLTLLSERGVFAKYKVDDFTVSKDEYRYYNIATIYRKADKKLGDDVSEAVDTIQCKGYSVGRLWCAYYFNDNLVYESEKREVVDIDILATGTVRYFDGFKLYADFCDSHYVAFDIKGYDVREIFDADITYTTQKMLYTFGLGVGESVSAQGDPVFVPTRTLTSMETGNNDGGILAKKYTWQRIQTAEDFIKECEEDANDTFGEAEKTSLKDCDFVFRFLETSVVTNSYGSSNSTEYTEVSSVGVLRLHFVTTGGKIYNLGVVSDLVGTDQNPELSVGNFDLKSFWELLKEFLLVIVFILFLIFFGPFVLKILEFVASCLKSLVKIVWSLISLPFRVIGSFLKNK